jgi:hypothetical protein
MDENVVNAVVKRAITDLMRNYAGEMSSLNVRVTRNRRGDGKVRATVTATIKIYGGALEEDGDEYSR